MSTSKTYHDRFIEAAMMFQARMGIQSQKDLAGELGINYMTLYKIMNKENRPTVEQCQIVLMRGGYDANWLFLGKGGKMAAENVTLREIKAGLTRIEQSLPAKTRR